MTIRVVIDTNIWISALINPTGFPAKLRLAFEEGLFEVVISEPILKEITDVLSRPRIKDKYGISKTIIKELLMLIDEQSEHTLLSGDVNICRDKDDNFIIETAIKGKAKYLITRDDDIKFDNQVSLFLSRHDISVVSITKFLKLIKKLYLQLL